MAITPGQAPGPFQLNLGAMQSNLSNTLNPGMLGNKSINPMDAVLQAGNQSKLGLQNSIANSRMQNIDLQGKEQALQQQEEQYKQDQQQPGLTDILGLLGSGIGAIKGIDSADQLKQLTSGMSPQQFQQMQDTMLNNPMTQYFGG